MLRSEDGPVGASRPGVHTSAATQQRDCDRPDTARRTLVVLSSVEYPRFVC